MGFRSTSGHSFVGAIRTLILGAAWVLAACSGGGRPTDVTRGNCDGPDQNVMCLENCSLGCSNRSACAITEIAQNQALIFVFSRALDPTSVNSSSVQLRTASGDQPSGDLLVNGAVLEFRPRVIAAPLQFLHVFEEPPLRSKVAHRLIFVRQ